MLNQWLKQRPGVGHGRGDEEVRREGRVKLKPENKKLQSLFEAFILQEFSQAEWNPYLLTMSECSGNLWSGIQGCYEQNRQLAQVIVCVHVQVCLIRSY